MVTRSKMGTPRSAAQMRSKTREPRQRFDIAVGAAGSEVRLPSIGLPRLSWRLASALLLVVFGFLFYTLWTAPQFTVTKDTVTVNGLHRVSLDNLLESADILDKPIFLIDTDDLEVLLKKRVPALEMVEASVTLSGGVVIDVVERVPVIVWNQQAIDQVWWVDMYGMRFKALGASDGLIHVVADVPPPTPAVELEEDEDAEDEDAEDTAEAVSTADDPGLLMEPELVEGIMEIPAYLPAGAELIYDDQHGIGWVDPEHGWEVYFGKQLDEMPLRLKIYQAIVDYLSDKNNQPVLISVEYVHAPYYRMEP